MVAHAYIIAGSEATGGIGVQVDLKTFHQLGVYGMGILTCIVPVDPKNDFNHRFAPIASELVHNQTEVILGIRDIDTVKIGMLGIPEMIDIVEEGLKSQEWEDVVLNPVFIRRGGELGAPTDEALKVKIFPLAVMATPNYSEACTLAGIGKLETIEDTAEAARRVSALGPKHAVVEGDVDFPGSDAIDLLWDGERATVFVEPKIGKYRVSGAGCTLVAAVTAELARGATTEGAVRVTRGMVTAAIKGRIPAHTTYDWAWQGAYRG